MNTPHAAIADSDQARRLRRALADNLLGLGNAPSWRDIFERVPRHVFIPRFFLDRENNGRYESIEGSGSRQHDEWLATVYSDEALVTQLDGMDAAGVPEGKPTSSSTMPSLMALMLATLDIRDGMRVLEIGTGTGYNAALLSEKLGSAYVTSVDIDWSLVESASERLSSLGYTPTLKAGDGGFGYKLNSPYDRILATVSLPSVPRAWIEQTRENGRILVNLYRDLGGGALVLLTVHDGQAEGKFLAEFGGFMPTRTTDTPDALKLLQAARGKEGASRPTPLDSHALDDPGFGVFAALRISASHIKAQKHGKPSEFWLIGRDGSWAYQTTDTAGQSIAVQGGQRRLWDELENVYREWDTLGRPVRCDFGLTVTRNERHLLWYKDPDYVNWEITPDKS
jgi:methyltransferase of ATP-grasp peptide maturase system